MGFRQALIEHVSVCEAASISAGAGSPSEEKGSDEYMEKSATRPQLGAYQ